MYLFVIKYIIIQGGVFVHVLSGIVSLNEVGLMKKREGVVK